MGPRQLRRLVVTGAAVVAIVLVATVRGAGPSEDRLPGPGPDTPVRVASVPAPQPAGPVSDEAAYLRDTRLLAEAMGEFAVLAMDLTDHEPLVQGRSGLDDAIEAVAAVALRTEGAGAPSRWLADLAAAVHQRWLVVRPVAMSERTADDGVLLVQALGREAGVRAAEMTSALDTLTGPARLAALEVGLARPWPDASQIGADTPA